MNVSSFAEWFSSILDGAKFWYMVNPWERAVRVRAGRYSKLIEPGTYFRIPFLDQVTLVNTRKRITSTPSLTVTTLDGKTVTMALMLAFRIEDPLAAMRALMNPECTCAAVAQAAAASCAAKMEAMALRTEPFIAAIKADLANENLPGIAFETIKITEMAVVRTLRLLNDSWKPMTDRPPDGTHF